MMLELFYRCAPVDVEKLSFKNLSYPVLTVIARYILYNEI